ncbi:glycosyltransferase [Microbacterium sp. STN6]|uniref:glycosyltransferase n=1 Tax=Microbacterium sp. STN6 TaxID=2995588 RepID=UPI002260C492|nr:glycosyltransferase [Microbacterium sp. STN6]MCX7521352.1 glycosyltransferase [Microbacterium sp. STN6]
MRVPRPAALLKRAKRAGRYEVHAYWRRRPIVPNTVLYESFSGNGMLDNPEAIFRALLAAPDLAHLKHIWVLSDMRQYASTIAEFAGDDRVSFVKYRSSAYFRALATSNYLVNNATFPADFGKRPGQVYLNTWHGTPLKRMGYDIAGGALDTANIVRNFVSADYLLAANEFMARQMYESAYKMENIYRGLIVEEGYPRIDRQRLNGAEAASARARLEDAGLPLGDREIILYAPTWKGGSFGRPDDDVDELLARVDRLESLIDTDRYVVLLKTHQIVHRLVKDRPELRRMLVPNELPTNVILGVSDMLITDYSSIYFDFLATGRPVLFLTPDIDEYAGYRGLYFEPDEWPGPAVRTVDELAEHVRQIASGEGLPTGIRARYEAAREAFCPFEDGHVSERVIDIVFRGNVDGHRVRRAATDGRPSILLYAGGMRPNGITTSMLNLLDHLDYDRYDVSAFFAKSRNAVHIAKQRELNPNVRQFPRVGGMNGSKVTQLARHLSFRRGQIEQHRTDPKQRMLWDDEWVRCFGDSRFDYVVDFSGYGPYWAMQLLHSPVATRSIWLHNDMLADAEREIRGHKPNKRSLDAVFDLYREYDHLVSVSPALTEINRRNLAKVAGPEKFLSAQNTVNSARILREGAVDLRVMLSDPETGELPAWALDLIEGPKRTTFVSVGRLSPEKNQARLIRAFAAVHAQRADTRLLLIGHGPLVGELEALIAELGLTDAVYLTGLQSNPYAIMAASDCFVLSSNYEGQPMVILEALTLGLPVVTVDFGSAKDALPAGVGLVVPTSDEDLAEGMRAFLAGDVTAGDFDPDEYNRRAMQQFYRAIGVEAPVATRGGGTASDSLGA